MRCRSGSLGRCSLEQPSAAPRAQCRHNSDTVKRKRLASPLKRKERIFVWIVLIPVLVQYTVTSVVPLFFSLFITFYDWSLMGFSQFVCRQNWLNMLKDPGVWGSLRATVNYALITLVLSVIVGLILALIVNTKLRGMGFFRPFSSCRSSRRPSS